MLSAAGPHAPCIDALVSAPAGRFTLMGRLSAVASSISLELLQMPHQRFWADDCQRAFQVDDAHAAWLRRAEARLARR